jgi:hypothetical protein
MHAHNCDLTFLPRASRSAACSETQAPYTSFLLNSVVFFTSLTYVEYSLKKIMEAPLS